MGNGMTVHGMAGMACFKLLISLARLAKSQEMGDEPTMQAVLSIRI